MYNIRFCSIKPLLNFSRSMVIPMYFPCICQMRNVISWEEVNSKNLQ